MLQTRKRPSSRRHHVTLSDDIKVPVPQLEPPSPAHARYNVTPLGHVYRDDGRLLRPNADLHVLFNGGRQQRSLPKIVFLAFGHPELHDLCQRGEILASYRPWVSPDAPIDDLTDRRRCSVDDVKLVPLSQLVRRIRSGRPPATQLSILELP
jgi:hypothetical protein